MKNRLLSCCINHICQLSISLVFFFSPFCVTRATVAATPPASHNTLSDGQPVLLGEHYGIHCFENNLPTLATTPQLSIPSKNTYPLRYEDQTYDLTQANGFSGYFDLSRWQKNYGDGGVDVTGAPNVALVEGADATLVQLIDQQSVSLKIDIPAEGYVRFDWRKIGGSYFSLEIYAGKQRFYLDKALNGHYISPLLKAGDQLRLTFSNLKELETSSTVSLEHFHFYTNAVQVITREWQVARKMDTPLSFVQYISIEPLDPERITFPVSRYISSMEAIYDPTSLHPEITGFPYYDKDGKEQTSDDRFYMESSNCALSLSWEDELVLEENNWTLLRHWRITDLLAQNIIEQTQVIILYMDDSEGYPRGRNKEKARDDFRMVFKPRPAIQYLDWQAPND